MAPSNRGAILVAKNETLEIQDLPVPIIGPKEMMVKAMAVAINPYDHICQEVPNLSVAWIKLPFVLGTDLAGEIVEIGSEITRFKVGDRIIAHAVALDKKVNSSREGAFQHYVAIREHMASIIPDSLSFEAASVLPLGLSTAACGLFQKHLLALPLPGGQSNSKKGVEARSKIVLIWGGATSVGCNAIQLAVAAGYDVFTTASPKNHTVLKTLGAQECFDYNDPAAVCKIISACLGHVMVGALCIPKASISQCIEIVSACEGEKRVVQCSLDTPAWPKSAPGFVPFILGLLWAVLSTKAKAALKGVKTDFVNGSDLLWDEVGKGIYEQFLPAALADGSFIAAPPANVVGNGLEAIQAAIDKCKQGVSAQKLVVRL